MLGGLKINKIADGVLNKSWISVPKYVWQVSFAQFWLQGELGWGEGEEKQSVRAVYVEIVSDRLMSV